jgi:hypothetical protein
MIRRDHRNDISLNPKGSGQERGTKRQGTDLTVGDGREQEDGGRKGTEEGLRRS